MKHFLKLKKMENLETTKAVKHVVARYIDGDSVIERQFVETFETEDEAKEEFESQKGDYDGNMDDGIKAGYNRVVTLLWLNVDEDTDESDLDWNTADLTDDYSIIEEEDEDEA